MRTELLAPAKDKETATAAIDCGADAVYIGASSFGARKKASNTIEDIKSVVDYAHKFWAKVFVTLNTILTDTELDSAVDLALELAQVGVDALIIQDLGLLKRLMEINYPIPLHMSTQCDNYLPQKIKFFNDIGLQRVVLARETSLEQIRKIHAENPNLELEGFVHGALCVSMSGQCYLSQYIGGRSANRGECAQPCRKMYTVETREGEVLKKDFYPLCLKDFNASNLLEEMVQAGIFSFKIEGRLKDSNYVKNIVAYYRQKLGKGISSGRSMYSFVPNPEKSFNRGFTEYFLKTRTDCFNFESPKSRGEFLGTVIDVRDKCFKLKTDKIINSQDGLYFKGDGCSVNKVIDDYIYPNKNISIQKGDKVFRNFDSEFEKELGNPIKRQIGVRILFQDSKILLTDEDSVSIELTVNQSETANNLQKMEENFVKQFSKTGDSDFYIFDIKIASELPFISIGEINQYRRLAFEKLMDKRLEIYYSEKKERQNSLKFVPYFLSKVDYKANVHNNSAKEFYEKCGVEVLEPSLETRKPNRQIDLMHCKHCIKFALNMCKSPKNLVLKDEFGKIYPLRFDCKNCEMYVLSSD